MMKAGYSANVARKVTMLICALCVLPIWFAQSIDGGRHRRHADGQFTVYVHDTTQSYELLFAICASAYLLALLVVHIRSPRLAPAKV